MTEQVRGFLVSGLVQGVGYRAFVARAAARLGLRGHARNLADGTVEVLVAGPAAALDSMEASLRIGPANGRVDRVAATEVNTQPNELSSFKIM